MSDQLLCPQCGYTITITEALSKQLRKDVEAKLTAELTKKEKEVEEKLAVTKQKELELQQQKETLNQEISKKTEEQVQVLKKELWIKAQEAATQQQNLKIKDLEEQLKERQQKTEELEKQELELRKQQRQLEEAKHEFELQMIRKFDEQRKTLAEDIEKKVQDEMRLKLLEKDKQLEDTKKALLEAQRKAAQGSQQAQGEVLELDLEKTLKEMFSRDGIEPVSKGVVGADIIQQVCNPSGQLCGVILWEVKQTKHWTEGWITKFKDDLRAQKANIPVLVTTALPKEIDGFGLYKGVWVTEPKLAVSVAVALRKNLLDVTYERSIASNKGEKADLLFGYVTSHEFRQRVEALVEVFSEMQSQIVKERIAFEKSWKQRESQLQRLFINTAGMYGEMQGLVGSAMPEIKGLELNSPQEPQLKAGTEMESKEQMLF